MNTELLMAITTPVLEVGKTDPSLWANSTYVLVVVTSLLAGAAVKVYDRWKKSSTQDEVRLDGHIEARITDLKDRIETLENQNKFLRDENKRLIVLALKKQRNSQ